MVICFGTAEVGMWIWTDKADVTGRLNEMPEGILRNGLLILDLRAVIHISRFSTRRLMCVSCVYFYTGVLLRVSLNTQ